MLLDGPVTTGYSTGGGQERSGKKKPLSFQARTSKLFLPFVCIHKSKGRPELGTRCTHTKFTLNLNRIVRKTLAEPNLHDPTGEVIQNHLGWELAHACLVEWWLALSAFSCPMGALYHPPERDRKTHLRRIWGACE